MKYLILSILLLVVGCSESTDNLYLVTTKVLVKQGQIDEVLQLFKETNPDLVKAEKNWKGAFFSADYDNNIVIVQAFWDGSEGYNELRGTQKFQNTMAQFRPYFESQPEVTITKFLYKM